ncbi:MAG TPA: alpha-2-macroglobulin, partial [Blastocatellia bacterium]|nr:alpha-2-macroglobulin [Blastocatellia bacterium]
MKYLAVVFALLSAFALATIHAQQPDYETLKAEAEKYYADASYSKAREVYVKARALPLGRSESRWIEFRLADTLWRAQAATNTADSTKYNVARQQLEVLVRDIERAEDRDRVWAEVYESLGDFWWMRNDSKNWQQGWQSYHQALDWWSGSADIETARDRYLSIVWKISKPSWSEAHYYYGYYGNYVPLEILDNGLKIAQTENDRAHLHYLIAMTLRGQGGDWERRQRVPEEFEAAIKPGKTTDWYDDSLYYYAEWMSSSGRITQLGDGQWKPEPDYVRAVELFRRLINEHQKGEIRYYDQAKNQIDNITKPTVGVSVSNVFLPESEIQFYLSWRNVKRVELALYKVDLTRDVVFSDNNDHTSNWVQRVTTTGAARIRAWAKDTEDKGDYRPGSETVRLDGKLATGAYLLEVKDDKATARDLILVSDASLVLKTSGKQALGYLCNAMTGAPLADANVKLWEHAHDGKGSVWRQQVKKTGADGIAVFDLEHANNGNSDLFAAAASADRQA